MTWSEVLAATAETGAGRVVVAGSSGDPEPGEIWWRGPDRALLESPLDLFFEGAVVIDSFALPASAGPLPDRLPAGADLQLWAWLLESCPLEPVRWRRIGRSEGETGLRLGASANRLLRHWLEAEAGEDVLARLRSREAERLQARLAMAVGELSAVRAALDRPAADPRGSASVQAFVENPGAADGAARREQWTAALEASEAITLDLWDTLLARCVARPTDLFWWVGQELAATTGWSPESFARRRIAAEASLRAEALAADRGDTTLAQVYDRLAAEHDWPDSRRRAAIAAEIGWERRMAYAHPFLQVLQGSSAVGRVRAILTEMYLPSELLGELLAAVGGPTCPIFTSAELGASKGGGGLFRAALERLELMPEAVTHFGDNPATDGAEAARVGLSSFLIAPGTPALVEEAGASPTIDDPLSGLFLGLARREAAQHDGATVAQRLGFELVGPLAWGLLHWLARCARRGGWRELWFLARDGAWLRHLWDRLPAGFRGEITPRYVFASRRLWGLAAITEISADDWDFLLKPAPGMRVRDFFERVGIDPAAAGAELPGRFGLPDWEAVLVHRTGFRDPEDRDRLYHLFVECIEAFHREREPLRARVLAYLESLAPTPGEVGLFDLGWHGSTARALDGLGQALGWAPLPVHHFATWARPAGVSGRPACLGPAWWVEEGQPASRRAALAPAVAVLEVLFTGLEPTIEDLREVPGGWAPVGTCGVPSAAAAQDLAAVWAGVESFFRAVGTFVPEPLETDPWDYVEAALRRLLWRPTAAEAALIGVLPHGEGWGLDRHDPLLPAAVEGLTGDALLAAWEATAWPAGLLARMTADQRAGLAAKLRAQGR